jgi:hypothetical protein
VNQIKGVPGIGQYRLIQETLTEVEAWLVPGHGFSEKTGEGMTEILKKIMGPQVTITVRIIDPLPLDPARKIRQLICRVQGDLRAGNKISSSS